MRFCMWFARLSVDMKLKAVDRDASSYRPKKERGEPQEHDYDLYDI